MVPLSSMAVVVDGWSQSVVSPGWTQGSQFVRWPTSGGRGGHIVWAWGVQLGPCAAAKIFQLGLGAAKIGLNLAKRTYYLMVSSIRDLTLFPLRNWWYQQKVFKLLQLFCVVYGKLNRLKQSNWPLPLAGDDARWWWCFNPLEEVWKSDSYLLRNSWDHITDTYCHRNRCIILIACWVPKGSWFEAFSAPTPLKHAVEPSRHGRCGWCWTGCGYGCNPAALTSTRQHTLVFMAFLAIPHGQN